MSRSHLDRVRLAGYRLRPLVGTVVVARLDVAAQNHAVAEGAADPYPSPFVGEGSRARADARARTSPSENPQGGRATPTGSARESSDDDATTGVARSGLACYAGGVRNSGGGGV